MLHCLLSAVLTASFHGQNKFCLSCKLRVDRSPDARSWELRALNDLHLRSAAFRKTFTQHIKAQAIDNAQTRLTMSVTRSDHVPELRRA